MITRNFNQDPAENFFGNIRSHGVRNINPTCAAFSSSYKTLIVNNFVSSQSPGANCERDDSEGALDCLKSLISRSSQPQMTTESLNLTPPAVTENVSIPDSDRAQHVKETHAYIAGFLARKILKKVGVCPTCRADLVGNGDEGNAALVIARSFKPGFLTCPNTSFTALLTKCSDIIHFLLPQICQQDNVRENLRAALSRECSNVATFSCAGHRNLRDMFYTYFIELYIHTWIKNVNRLLKGDDSRPGNVNDSVKVLAIKRYVTYKSRKEKVRLMKRL